MIITEVADANVVAPKDGKVVRIERLNTSHLRLIDYATFALLLTLTLLLTIFHRDLSFWPWLVGANVAGCTLLWAFTWYVHNKSRSRILIFLRDAYPVFLYTFVFKQVSLVLAQIFPFWFERILIDWDYALFGTHPTVWVQEFFTPWLTEFMAFSYWSYYIFIPLVALLLYKKRRSLFHSYIFHLTFTFYTCYFFFLVLTARSPHATLAHLHRARELVGFFDHFVATIQGAASISGAAFPSSHVAAQCVAWFFLFKFSRTHGWLGLPLVISLSLSVVYMQYHYAVDAIAGVVLPFMTYPLARFLETKFRHRNVIRP